MFYAINEKFKYICYIYNYFQDFLRQKHLYLKELLK